MQDGKLSLGHAKVLLGLDDENKIVALSSEVVRQGWSVRELERRVKDVLPISPGKKVGRPRTEDRRSPEVRRLEDRLRRFLQTDITINVADGNRGTVSIQFYSADDLERILERMGAPE